MKNICLTFIGIVIAGSIFQSCTKETQSETSVSDQSIGQMIRQSNSAGTIFSSNDNQLKSSSAATYRIRLNKIAMDATKLNSLEPLHSVYPSGAMLIKEYLDALGNVTAYDVMYKSASDPASFAGWVWCSFDAQGNTTYSSAMKGASCNSCHASGADGVLKTL